VPQIPTLTVAALITHATATPLVSIVGLRNCGRTYR
jgi:hypothetical protein